MGIITTFPDNSKRYLSINDNKVIIEKFFGGHMVNSNAPPLQYKISATFDIYTLTDDGMVDNAVGNTVVSIYLPDIADINLYSRLYEQVKLTLHNAEDDYVTRVPEVHTHEE
jgi:hypothetical protein